MTRVAKFHNVQAMKRKRLEMSAASPSGKVPAQIPYDTDFPGAAQATWLMFIANRKRVVRLLFYGRGQLVCYNEIPVYGK